MAKTIVEQYEKRKNELSMGTRQNILIDARGQGITYSQEQKIIQKIIEKSNGTIKKSDITIWKQKGRKMEELSTQEYNELYKKYFKEIFSKPMKDLGFKKKGTGKFCRLNKLGLFEYIGFFRYYQKLRLEYAIIPIYSNMMKNSIGNGGDTKFVDLDSEEKMEKGMKEILNEIENSIIPWFQKYILELKFIHIYLELLLLQNLKNIQKYKKILIK